jgi:hypothetical protein
MVNDAFARGSADDLGEQECDPGRSPCAAVSTRSAVSSISKSQHEQRALAIRA